MTIDKTKEAIAVMQAYVDGKTIESRIKGANSWISVEPEWKFDTYDYRIKPEPHYRPFKNAEEVMDAIKEHGSWVKRITTGKYLQIYEFDDEYVWTISSIGSSYSWALGNIEFIDGTPFGKLAKE